MKKSLAVAYSAKRSLKGKSCPECMAMGGKCYAHGGMVESDASEMADSDMPSTPDSAMEKKTADMGSNLSVSESILSDRKKLKTPVTEEMDAPEEDGRESRGLNLEPVHTMSDDEHDTSDASLVSQILKDRKKRRMGM